LATEPKSQLKAAPVPHDPWLAVMLLMISEESRFSASVASCAALGPRLFTVATQLIAVPVVAVLVR